MIELLTDLPDDVVGFEAKGEVTASDYTGVLDPAIRAALGRHDRIRILYVLGREFTGYSGAAMWEDAAIGTEHFRSWERIAVVTDTDWVRHSVHAVAWMMPTRVRVYRVDEQDAAVAWVSEP